MNTEKQTSFLEARIFAKYLIGKKIDNNVCEKYYAAINFHALECEGRDRRLENFLLKFPFWVGFVDAALALTCKKSVLRKKIFVMLAVLEAIPEYSVFFLPKKYSFFSFVKIFFVGIRSIYRFLIGVIIVRSFGKSHE